MEWKPDRMDRLYELYRQHISRLHAAVIETNRSLGFPQPEQTKLECLPRAEIERLLTMPSDDPEVTMTRGNGETRDVIAARESAGHVVR